MSQPQLIETAPGRFSLLLEAGTTEVDDLVVRLGHEPNGPFWEGVAQFLVSTEAPDLEGRFCYDPEAGMFRAHGTDRTALAQLAALIGSVAADEDRMRQLVTTAEANGFAFDD